MIWKIWAIHVNIYYPILYTNSGSQCRGNCGQGEGDCDNNEECQDGLWCEFDYWWGDDYCRAGKMKNWNWRRLQNFCILKLHWTHSLSVISLKLFSGPETVNYAWSAWGEYGDCSVSCGGDGTQERFRYCNPPKKGGFPCPSQMDSSTRTCNNGPCPGTYPFLIFSGF